MGMAIVWVPDYGWGEKKGGQTHSFLEDSSDAVGYA